MLPAFQNISKNHLLTLAFFVVIRVGSLRVRSIKFSGIFQTMGAAASSKRSNVQQIIVEESDRNINDNLQDNATEPSISPTPARPRIAKQHSTKLSETFADVDPLEYEVVDGVAVISLGGASNEVTPWGTKVKEHRLYPGSVLALNDAFTQAEEDDSARAVVVKAEGFYWSNGFDLKWLSQ